MRFLGSKFTQNVLAAGAPPRTPLGELKRSPDPLPNSGGRFAAEEERERRAKEGGGKGKRGYWEEKEGGKGRGEGGKGEGAGKERGGEVGRGSLRHWR